VSHYHSPKGRTTRPPPTPNSTEKQALAKLVGVRLQSERVNQGIGLAVISETGGMTASHLSLLERGLVNPLVHSICRMAQLLDIPAPLLFVDESTIEAAWEFWRNPPRVIVNEEEARLFASIVVFGMDKASIRALKARLTKGGEESA
jgi:transcriptional regulator with XRE-family HTH domain